MSNWWAYIEIREEETLGVIEHIRGTSSLDDRETTAALMRNVSNEMEELGYPDASMELRIAAAKLDLAEGKVKEWARLAKFKYE